MIHTDLNDDTYLIIAMKAYDSPNVLLSEFEEDLKRIKYIKRLIKKYQTSGYLKERLILNHIIVLGNVFGIEQCVRILFYKLQPEEYPVLKTILLYLNYMPHIVNSVKGRDIYSADITVDLNVGKLLRAI